MTKKSDPQRLCETIFQTPLPHFFLPSPSWCIKQTLGLKIITGESFNDTFIWKWKYQQPIGMRSHERYENDPLASIWIVPLWRLNYFLNSAKVWGLHLPDEFSPSRVHSGPRKKSSEERMASSLLFNMKKIKVICLNSCYPIAIRMWIHLTKPSVLNHVAF